MRARHNLVASIDTLVSKADPGGRSTMACHIQVESKDSQHTLWSSVNLERRSTKACRIRV